MDLKMPVDLYSTIREPISIEINEMAGKVNTSFFFPADKVKSSFSIRN